MASPQFMGPSPSPYMSYTALWMAMTTTPTFAQVIAMPLEFLYLLYVGALPYYLLD